MPKPQPACVENLEEGHSSGDNVEAGSKVSASIAKQDRKAKKDRSHRKEKKSRSEDGIIKIERRDDEETVADNIRVIPAQKESRRKSMASAPVGGASPRKHSSRPLPTRERSVTFDNSTRHHDKGAKEYFGRRDDEDIRFTTNAARPPVSSGPRVRPTRPMSMDARVMPVQFQQPYPSPMVFAPAGNLYSPQGMPSPYEEEAYFAPQPQANSLASRFGRTGQPTLSTVGGLPFVEPRPQARRQTRREPRREHRREIDYDYEEDEVDSEEEALQEDKEKIRQQRLLAARQLEEEEKQKRRERDRARMPPPPSGLQRHSSQRDHRARTPYLPDSPSFEDIRAAAQRRHRDSRDSFGSSARPKITQTRTEPPPPMRRQSISRAPPFASAANLPRRPHHKEIEIDHGRRSSFYGGGTSGTGTTASSNYEDNLRGAEAYQNDLAAEAQRPLTEDWLSAQQRAIGAGSRSTRSTVSRDESEKQRSSTTRTTRSGSGDGNDALTFTINGTAKLKIGNAQLETTGEDGDVRITLDREPSSGTARAIRNGSEVSCALSGDTAVSDDFVARPKPLRRESHRPRSSVDDARSEPRHDPVRDHRLRSRLDGRPATSRRESHHLPTDYERGPWV